MLSLDDIELLFARHGDAQYSGEPVTQLEHALQTAHLAEQSEASDELVTACLLHDLGHLLNEQGETPTLRGIDDTHQYFALPFLRGLFPDAVLDAIRLHVDAKRYLCRADAGYYGQALGRFEAQPRAAGRRVRRRRRPPPSSPSRARATRCCCASGTTSPSRPTGDALARPLPRAARPAAPSASPA